MSELKEFVNKRTCHFSGISIRKLYGLDSFYIRDIPFIVISSDDEIIVKVEDFEVKKSVLKISHVSEWILNEKVMQNWFVLPKTFNKKKSKLSPILEMTSKALLYPKKEKKKIKSKSKSQSNTDDLAVDKLIRAKDSPTFYKRILQFFSKD
jgi:hypothetical protein